MKRTFVLLFAWILLILGGFWSSCLAEIPPIINVRLFEAHPNIQNLKISGAFQSIQPLARLFSAQVYNVTNKNGQVKLTKATGKTSILQASRILFRSPPGKRISLHPEGLPVRHYSGVIELSVDAKGHLKVINQVPAQTYVTLVVGSETMPNWPAEALKAQAILTQTRLARYKPEDALGDSTQQEAYLGEAYRRPAVEKAVSAVWGESLYYEGRPIIPFYHASCGGHTSDGRFFSSERPLPWLVGVSCPYCQNAPFSKATRTRIANAVLNKSFLFPTVLRRDAAGRPLTVQLNRGRTISGYDFWLRLGQQYGWDKAPGTRFSITRLSNNTTQITSNGAGHGVGLCQWGAAEMARRGKTAQQILKFYFPKTKIVKLRF